MLCFKTKFDASEKFFMLRVNLKYEESHHNERASTCESESDDDRVDSISDFPHTICRTVPSRKNDEMSGRNLRILIKERDFSRTGCSGCCAYSLSLSLSPPSPLSLFFLLPNLVSRRT